jgi:hypothetical protein
MAPVCMGAAAPVLAGREAEPLGLAAEVAPPLMDLDGVGWPEVNGALETEEAPE